MTAPAVLLALAVVTSGPPPCWIRDAPADLELRISRLDSIITTLGVDTLTICYSRPRKLGRPVMGRLVPFGEPWRLGANEATTLHTPISLVIGDIEVPPGSYSLYGIPGPHEWRLVVNGAARRWGIPIDAQVRSADLGVTTSAVERLAETVEAFTMRFERVAPRTVDLVMEWEQTRVRVLIRGAER